MSQYLAYRGFSLQRAAVSTKVLLTAFNVVVALAVAMGVAMYQVRTRLTPAGTADYYGEPTALELLDATHPHLFASAFLLFVLGHLFALTRVSQRIKTRLAILGFVAVVLDAAAPWIIRFVWLPFATIGVLNTALMASVVTVYLVVPIWELWFARPSPQP